MSKKSCKRGHTRTPENTVERFGIRTCLDCEREKDRPARRKRTQSGRTRAQSGPKRSNPDTRPPATIEALERAAAAVIIDGDSIRRAAEDHGVGERVLTAEAWARAKDLVRLRDGDRCWGCGAYGQHDVHHRRGRGSGGTSNPRIGYGLANLILLDRGCHERAEANFESSHARGLRVRQSEDPAAVPLYRHDSTTPVWLTHRGTITKERP